MALPLPPTLRSVSLPGEESGASPGTGFGSGSPEIKSLARRWPGQGSCGDGHRQDRAHSCGAWPVGCRDVKARDHGGRHDMSGRDCRKLHSKSQVLDQWAFHPGPLVLRTQYRRGGEGPGSPEASLGPGQPGQRSRATARPPPPPPPRPPQLARTPVAVPGLKRPAREVLLCRSRRSSGTRPLWAQGARDQREDSGRAQKAKALTGTQEPFAQECKWQPRGHLSESPRFQPRLFRKAVRHACLPAEDSRAEDRTFWRTWQRNTTGCPCADLGGSWTPSVHRPRASFGPEEGMARTL